MLPVALQSLRSFKEPARFGIAVKKSAKSVALTSFGVRGTSLRTVTAHDLTRSVVTSPHVAVAGNGLILASYSNRATSIASTRRRASDSLAAIEGVAQCTTPSCSSGAAAAGYGSRNSLLLASAARAASQWPLRRRERGAGRTEAGASQVTRHRSHGRATRLEFTQQVRHRLSPPK